jgi:hypothetical protein
LLDLLRPKKFRERNSQRLGDYTQVEQGQVAFASFDRANERPVKPALFSKLLLREFPILADRTDTLAQSSQKVDLVKVHLDVDHPQNDDAFAQHSY